MGLSPRPDEYRHSDYLVPVTSTFLQFLLRPIKSGNAASMNPKHMAFGILIFVEVTVLNGNGRLAVGVSEAILLAGSRTLLSSSKSQQFWQPETFR